MKTIYVTHQIVTTGKFCLVVRDDADLVAQLIERERILREELKWTPKVERDKAGKPKFFEMGPDWPDGWKGLKWDPNI